MAMGTIDAIDYLPYGGQGGTDRSNDYHVVRGTVTAPQDVEDGEMSAQFYLDGQPLDTVRDRLPIDVASGAASMDGGGDDVKARLPDSASPGDRLTLKIHGERVSLRPIEDDRTLTEADLSQGEGASGGSAPTDQSPPTGAGSTTGGESGSDDSGGPALAGKSDGELTRLWAQGEISDEEFERAVGEEADDTGSDGADAGGVRGSSPGESGDTGSDGTDTGGVRDGGTESDAGVPEPTPRPGLGAVTPDLDPTNDPGYGHAPPPSYPDPPTDTPPTMPGQGSGDGSESPSDRASGGSGGSSGDESDGGGRLTKSQRRTLLALLAGLGAAKFGGVV